MRLLEDYRAVRARTLALAAPLSAEDQMVQSMPDASPTKWHLAHTTWFFETFVLAPAGVVPRNSDPRYRWLFNSYYDAVGDQPDRARRGTLCRPALAAVLEYRQGVDDAVLRLLESGDPSAPALGAVELGIHHEEQHQELLLTDIKHAFGMNPFAPAYGAATVEAPGESAPVPPARLVRFDEGLAWIGHEGPGFAFDNEGPRHRRFLRAFEIADRPVTNGEFLAFLSEGGYERPELWLSDGWQARAREGWRAPLYWTERDGRFTTYTLRGERAVDEREPVMHVSYYEADAYARWAGARLPGEDEWERAAAQMPVSGLFADAETFHPGPARAAMFGDVWQWTRSPYVAYPGYRPPPGAFAEYNGKFMCNQMVLRGGSCLTPANHLRASYRNFFPPSARWQATGIRLARDA